MSLEDTDHLASSFAPVNKRKRTVSSDPGSPFFLLEGSGTPPDTVQQEYTQEGSISPAESSNKRPKRDESHDEAPSDNPRHERPLDATETTPQKCIIKSQSLAHSIKSRARSTINHALKINSEANQVDAQDYTQKHQFCVVSAMRWRRYKSLM